MNFKVDHAKTLYLIIILILTWSCSTKRQKDSVEKWYEYINVKYNSYKDFFEESQLDHFPKDLYEIDNIGRALISNEPNFDCIGYSQGVFYSKDKFDSISSTIKETSIATYGNNDSIFLIYNQFIDKDVIGFKRGNSSREKLIINTASDYGALPIPNFSSYTDETNLTSYKLPRDYTIYVLDSKPGKYWNDKYLISDEFNVMPDKWRHGYSKGFVLNDKRLEVIYWFMIW